MSDQSTQPISNAATDAAPTDNEVQWGRGTSLNGALYAVSFNQADIDELAAASPDNKVVLPESIVEPVNEPVNAEAELATVDALHATTEDSVVATAGLMSGPGEVIIPVVVKKLDEEFVSKLPSGTGKTVLETGVSVLKFLFGNGERVQWELDNSQNWHDTSDAVRNEVGISQYRLFAEKGGPFGWFEYRVDFKTISGAGMEFYFQDKTGDRYKKRTFGTGEYSIRYNSKNPVITDVGRAL